MVFAIALALISTASVSAAGNSPSKVDYYADDPIGVLASVQSHGATIVSQDELYTLEQACAALSEASTFLVGLSGVVGFAAYRGVPPNVATSLKTTADRVDKAVVKYQHVAEACARIEAIHD